MRALVLSVFDAIQGPVGFLCDPPNALSDAQRGVVCKLMDIHDEGFFLHIVGDIHGAHLSFKIPSKIGRGQVESLLVSIMLQKGPIDPPMLELLKALMEIFARRCKETPNLYCVMHPKTPEHAGKVQEIKVLFQDFAEISRSAVKANRQDEIRYQALFKAARDGILLLDFKTGCFLDANQQAEKIVGRTLAEIRGKTPLELGMHTEQEYQGIRADILKQVKNDSLPPFESLVRLPGSRSIPVEISASRILFWDQLFLQCIFRDITERKQADLQVQTRLRYESGIAECSRALFSRTADPVPRALEAILKASTACRVHIFKNFQDSGAALCCKQVFETCAPVIQSLHGIRGVHHINYADAFARWPEALVKGQAIKGIIKDFPAAEQTVLKCLGIVSILVLPISRQGEWIGFLGIDDTRVERQWNENDVRLLHTAAQMIGPYIA